MNTDLKELPDILEKGIRTSIEENTRISLQEIIKREEVKLLATHSNFIGLGLGCKSGKPCIVLYCVDNSLIPFGEPKLPNYIEDFTVDLKNDIVMFGHWFGSKTLTARNINIEPCLLEYEGSNRVLVSRYKSLSIVGSGFLTCTHVATVIAEMHIKKLLVTTNPLPVRNQCLGVTSFQKVTLNVLDSVSKASEDVPQQKNKRGDWICLRPYCTTNFRQSVVKNTQ